jgi:hypothetical protein
VQSSQEKIDFIRNAYSAPRERPEDAQALLVYFKDADPNVRQAAYGASMSARLSTAEQVFAVMDAAWSDPDPGARQSAEVAWVSLHAIPADYEAGAGLEPDALPALEKIALSDKEKNRLKAVIALGSVQAAVPDTYLKLLRDKDVSIRIAAVDASARAMGGLMAQLRSVNMKMQSLPPVIVSLLMEDPLVQEPAGLAVYIGAETWPSSEFEAFFAKFDKSASLDERAIAALTRDSLRWRPAAHGPTRDRIAEGVRSRYAWVRRVATDRLFRWNPGDTADINEIVLTGRETLLAAVSDTNPDVAHDAALRLCDALPSQIMHVTYVRAATEFRDTKPRVRLPAINTQGFDSKDAQERLQAVKGIEQTAADAVRATRLLPNRDPGVCLDQTVIGVVLATRLFADPDPRVAKAAREIAMQLIKQQQQRP